MNTIEIIEWVIRPAVFFIAGWMMCYAWYLRKIER